MRKILSFCTAILMAFAVNAAVINIDNSTADALRLALASANAGDEIVMAAGTYVESNADFIAFDKDIIVRAAADAEVIIQPQVSATISGGSHVELINLKWDISRFHELQTWYEHAIYASDESEDNSLTLEGCEFYNFPYDKSVISCRGSNKLDTLIINNCYFHNITKSCVYIENTATGEYLSVTNSTFANVVAGEGTFHAGPVDTRSASGKIVVDHCTFYNCEVLNSDFGAVGYRTTGASDVTVSNSIFSMPSSYGVGRAIYYSSTSGAVNNCLTYNYTKDSGHEGIHSGPTRTACIFNQNPLFADAANSDFHLGDGSPALAAGTDGSNLGDPRWYPAAAEDVYSVAGSFNEWNASANVMTEVEEDIYMAQFTLTEYNEFKVVKNGSEWIGYASEGANVNAALSEQTIEPANDNFKVIFPGTKDVDYYVVNFFWNAAEEKVYIQYDLVGNTFTLVGDQAIVGTAWDPTAAANDMIDNGDGTLSLVKSDVVLSAGNYGYKVACNHDWNVNFGDPNSGDANNNAILAIAEDGTYDITFSIGANKVLSANAVMQVPFSIADGYYLIGKIEGVEDWAVTSLTAERKFEPFLQGSEGEWFVNATLAEGDAFKVVNVVANVITTWYPGDGTTNYSVDADHAGTLKHVLFRPEGEDHPLNHDGWHYGKIYVEPNPRNIALTTNWSTLCLPYYATFFVEDNIEAYSIASVSLNDGLITLQSVDALEAGNAYLVRAAAAGNYQAKLAGGPVDEPSEINGFIGNLDLLDHRLYVNNEKDYYILSNNQFHLLSGEAYADVPQYKAHLQFVKNQNPAPALRIAENATNIENLGADENAVKFIQNGQLFIKRNGVVYTATGAVVK